MQDQGGQNNNKQQHYIWILTLIFLKNYKISQIVIFLLNSHKNTYIRLNSHTICNLDVYIDSII